jgi:hypothetical protein
MLEIRYRARISSRKRLIPIFRNKLPLPAGTTSWVLATHDSDRSDRSFEAGEAVWRFRLDGEVLTPGTARWGRSSCR